MSKQNKVLVPELRFPEFMRGSGWDAVYGNKAFEQISNKDHDSDLPILAITQEYGAIPREMIDYNVSVTEKSVQSYKVVDVGDFIISLRSFQGGIEYSEYKGLCSPAYVILRNKKGIDKRFFKQYFKAKSFIRDLTKNLEGLRDGKMISYKQFSEVLLPKPSTEEQQKIADCLASIDELIALHTQKLDALKDHKKGLMQQLFPIEGKKVPKMRFPEFRKAGEWEKCALSDVATIRSGSTPSTSNPEFYEGGDIPWVKTTDLNNSFITVTEVYVTSKAKVKVNAIGSVLVAMYGGFKQIGRTGILKVPAATNQALSVLNIDRKKVAPEYVLVWLNAKVGLWRKIASSSRKDPNITGSDVSKFPIAFPEIGEQRKIVDCIFSVEEMISEQSEKVSSLIVHKNGLVQKLFPVMDDVVSWAINQKYTITELFEMSLHE